jgi:hypothetical protein
MRMDVRYLSGIVISTFCAMNSTRYGDGEESHPRCPDEEKGNHGHKRFGVCVW